MRNYLLFLLGLSLTSAGTVFILTPSVWLGIFLTCGGLYILFYLSDIHKEGQ